MLGSINPPAVLFFVTRAQRTLKRKQRAFEQATMIFTRVLNLSNVAFLANLFRFKDGFSKLQMISKTKAFPYFFFVSLHVALWRLIEPFHCFLLSSSSFHFLAQPTDSTIFLRQTCLSDQSIRSAQDQTTTPDHQIRPPPPHCTTRSDHPSRPQTTILDYSASNQHSIPNLLKWYRSGAFLMGWVKGGI